MARVLGADRDYMGGVVPITITDGGVLCRAECEAAMMPAIVSLTFARFQLSLSAVGHHEDNYSIVTVLAWCGV